MNHLLTQRPTIPAKRKHFKFGEVQNWGIKNPIICTYAITCKKTKQTYVGSTQEFRVRWARHLQNLRGGYHKNVNLQRVFNEHGVDAFTIEILNRYQTTNELLLLEEIDALRFNHSDLLNVRVGSSFINGYCNSEGDGSKSYTPKKPYGKITKARWFDKQGVRYQVNRVAHFQ